MRVESYRAWTLRRLDLLQQALPPAKVETVASVADLLDEEFGVVGRRLLKAPPRDVRRTPRHVPWIEGLYAIGSAGTVSVTIESDFDLWLVVRGRSVAERAALRRAAGHLEAWAAERGVEVRLFVHEAEEVAAGRFGEDEEGAEALGAVLAEEFFRTCLWLGGRPPGWWVDDDGGGARWETPLALGAPRTAPAEAYLAATVHQVEKALERPFKSLLKVAALRAWAEGRIRRPPAERVREAVAAGRLDGAADPYLGLVEAVWEAFREAGDAEAFRLVKTCLYLKGVVEEAAPARVARWAERLARAGFFGIGPPIDAADLDGFLGWPLDRRLDLARSIQAYLRATLSALGRAGKSPWALETARVLVRRLQARAAGAGRVEGLSALGVPAAGDLFTLVGDGVVWSVLEGAPRAGGPPPRPIRRTPGAVEAVAFLVANQLVTPGRTQVRFLPPAAGVRRTDDLVRRMTRLVAVSPRREACLAPEAAAEALVVWMRGDLRDAAADRATRLVRTTWGGLVHATFVGAAGAAAALDCSIGGPPTAVHVDFVGPDEEALAGALERAASAGPGEFLVVPDLDRFLVLGAGGVEVADGLLAVLDAVEGTVPRLVEAPSAVRALVEAIDAAPAPAVHLVETPDAARLVARDEAGAWHVWPASPSDLDRLGPSVWRFLVEAGVEPAHALVRRHRPRAVRDGFDAEEVDPFVWVTRGAETSVVVEADGAGAPVAFEVGGRPAAGPDSVVAAAGAVRDLRAGRASYPVRVTRVLLPAGVPKTPGALLRARRRAERAIEAAWRRGRSA